MSTAGAPSDPLGSSTVVYDGKMCIWGSFNDSNEGGCYDPAANSWSEISSTGAPPGRYNHMAAVVGEKMCIFGGYKSLTPVLNDGGCYDFTDNTWTLFEGGSSGPAGRTAVRGASVGNSFCFLGGAEKSTRDLPLADGWCYKVSESRWTA